MRGIANTPPKEMADVHYCLTFAHDPGTFHSTKKKIVVPGDIKGMKIRPANATIARFISILGGTNVQASAPEVARRAGKGRRRGDHLPVGLDRAVRHRQGDEVSPRQRVLRHRAGLGDQQGQVRGAVRRAEEGDRRSLHARMVREDRGAMGRLRGRRARQDQGAGRTRARRADARRSSPNGARPPSRSMPNGPRT